MRKYLSFVSACIVISTLSACSNDNSINLNNVQCEKDEFYCTEDGELFECTRQTDGRYRYSPAGNCVNLDDPDNPENPENPDNPINNTCTNLCAESGANKCFDNASSVCTDTNNDGCFEWSEPTPCEEKCDEETGQCICLNECEESEKAVCSDDNKGFKTCTKQPNGCFKWSKVTSCSYQCKDGECICDHKCQKNAKQCSGNGYVECTTDENGCRIWSTEVKKCTNGCSEGACIKLEMTRYPGDQILSPITPYSVKKMKEIAAKNANRSGAVFAKIGDSHFDTSYDKPNSFMYCFGETPPKWNGADYLQTAVDNFKSTSVNSFSRNSKSAIAGYKVIQANNEELITKEINAINPRFAFIDYGTNDMGWASTTKGWYENLESYYREYKKALETMINAGVIPLIVGTGLRVDFDTWRLYVPIFNAVNRGLAEYYQIPYFNLELAMIPLKAYNYGINPNDVNKVHHSSSGNPCDFTSDAMNYGANMRNRYGIEMLYNAWQTVVNDQPAPVNTTIPYKGSGTKANPYIIDSLPYTRQDTTVGGENNFSAYECQSNVDESGPEKYYQLKLTETKTIWAIAVSNYGVDADIHLKTSLDDNNCLARGNAFVQGTLNAGTYYFVIDTYSENNTPKSGEYLFGILECDKDNYVCSKEIIGG